MAANWYLKAADQGNVDAQFNLCPMYYLGAGVPKDVVMSYMYCNLAAAHGHQKAKEIRDIVERHMSSAQIGEAQKLSREWKPKP